MSNLVIEHLWLDEPYRELGSGRQLMSEADAQVGGLT